MCVKRSRGKPSQQDKNHPGNMKSKVKVCFSLQSLNDIPQNNHFIGSGHAADDFIQSPPSSSHRHPTTL